MSSNFLFIISFLLFSPNIFRSLFFFALYIEYVLEYKPCKLCLYQRIPYVIAIFISFIGYNYFKNDKILILILIIFLISALISGYRRARLHRLSQLVYGDRFDFAFKQCHPESIPHHTTRRQSKIGPYEYR